MIACLSTYNETRCFFKQEIYVALCAGSMVMRGRHITLYIMQGHTCMIPACIIYQPQRGGQVRKRGPGVSTQVFTYHPVAGARGLYKLLIQRNRTSSTPPEIEIEISTPIRTKRCQAWVQIEDIYEWYVTPKQKQLDISSIQGESTE